MRSLAHFAVAAFALATFACASSPPRPAAEPAAEARTFATKEEAARYLARLMGVGQVDASSAMSRELPNNPAANELRLVMAAWTEKYAPADSVRSIQAALYAKHLSLVDLVAIIRFHESPAGRHLIAAQPAIMGESLASVQKLLAPHQQEIQDAMTRMMMRH